MTALVCSIQADLDATLDTLEIAPSERLGVISFCVGGVELWVFPGADHGFTWPDWPTYDENAAAVCFERTTSLFQTHLGPHESRPQISD